MIQVPYNSIMIDVEGFKLSQQEKILLSHDAIGGVILFARNYESLEQLHSLCQEIKAIKSPSLVIAVDHEGGRVQRFQQGFSKIPAMRSLGKMFDQNQDTALQLAFATGNIIGYELSKFQIDLNFSPVLDIDLGKSEIIADRSFHRSSVAIKGLCHYFIGGLKAQGMSAVGKHYPSHAGTTIDTHLDMAKDDRDLEQIKEDISIYEYLASAELLNAVMLSHVIFPKIDDAPVSLSMPWIQKIHDSLGPVFKFSDDLTMKGLSHFGSMLDLIKKSIEACNDMAIICNQYENRFHFMNEVEAHDTEINRIDECNLSLDNVDEHEKLENYEKSIKILKENNWLC